MRRGDAVVLSFCLAIIAMSALYVLNPPAPIYYPLARTWSFEKTPGVPLMAWYGRSLWALGGGLAVLAVALPVTLRWSKSGQAAPEWVPVVLRWLTLIALVVALGDTIVHEYTTWFRR